MSRKFWTWVVHCLSIFQENFCDFRPWGSYRTVDRGDGFQVKTITVKPGGKLSLQKHTHRSERWVVVSGMLTITIGDEVSLKSPGDMVEVPVGVPHRIHNENAKFEGVLVEVQLGQTLEESDIERLQDDYGRR